MGGEYVALIDVIPDDTDVDFEKFVGKYPDYKKHRETVYKKACLILEKMNKK